MGNHSTNPLRLHYLSVVLLLAGFGARSAEPPPDYRFKPEILATSLVQPMELEVASDGRVFFNEIGGRLRLWKPGTREISEVGDVAVFAGQENGFLGFALDPAFATNGWIYLFYSPTNLTGQRLSRFIIRDDRLEPASEKVVLEFPEQRKDCCHHAGSVEFAPDGNLFISTGDNTHPGGDSDGYAPIDERPGREEYDAQDGPANTHDLRGKVLRIRPTPDGGYSIPEGNLFPRDGSQGRPEIYVMGCRNPWRLSVDSKTGFIYWGEVGPDAGGDGPRGSRGYDEINQAKQPGNFGWPYFVGPNAPYRRYDFATRTAGDAFDPLQPVNEGRANTGSRRLPPAQPAFIYWPYGESREFPSLGSGGRTACAGPVFRYQPGFAQTDGFPEFFDGCLLFYDWQRPFLKWARLDAESRLAGIESFTTAVTLANDASRIAAARQRGEFVLRRVVDSQFGPDGCLYLLDYGETWGVNPDASLVRISYQRGNLPPVARAQLTPPAGREPLTVTLSAAGSFDHENSPLRFEWRLQPGNRSLGEHAEGRATIQEPGNYVVELRVTDSAGAQGTTQLPLVVGNAPPTVRFVTPQEGDFFEPGRPVAYAIEVQDAEDGSSSSAEEVMDPRIHVSARWSRADGRESVDPPGLALMKQSDCFNCHAVENRVVGPPLLEIATRYRDQTGALEASAKRVILGSSRVWGEVPMLPHASLTEDQAQLMVRWIFSLKDGQSGAGFVRGLQGELPFPAEAAASAGRIEAVYTDQGRPPADSLSGRASVKLRPRRIQAEQADEIRGARVLGGYVGAIDHGHWLRLGSLNLTDSTKVTVRVASAGVGGTVEVRSGAPDGPLLASHAVAPTGGWENWKELSAPLAASPRSEIFVVFVNPGQGGLMNLDWIQFERNEARP